MMDLFVGHCKKCKTGRYFKVDTFNSIGGGEGMVCIECGTPADNMKKHLLDGIYQKFALKDLKPLTDDHNPVMMSIINEIYFNETFFYVMMKYYAKHGMKYFMVKDMYSNANLPIIRSSYDITRDTEWLFFFNLPNDDIVYFKEWKNSIAVGTIGKTKTEDLMIWIPNIFSMVEKYVDAAYENLATILQFKQIMLDDNSDARKIEFAKKLEIVL